MAEYISLTKSQFQQHGLTVIKIEMQGKFAARLEYSGTMRSMSLHWYARAIKRGNQVYLVTGTALDAQWSAVEALLRRCVDSFRLD